MASGKTHEKINIIFIFIATLSCLFFLSVEHTHLLGLLVLGYIIGTFWMNPDLDIKSRPYNRWMFLRFLWKPYQLLGHRSVWTHGYVISDVIRYLYLLLFVILILLLLSLLPMVDLRFFVEFAGDLFVNHRREVIAFFMGNVLSSSVHTLTDQASSSFKRLFKRKK